jgi:hypothetical protein
VPDIFHRRVEAARHIAVGSFETTHPAKLRIEIGSKPGTVGVERVKLLRKNGAAAVNLDPAFHRRIKHVERRGEAPDGLLD